MITVVGAFALAFVISAVGTPTIRSLAVRNRLVDDSSSSRKVHTTPTPRLGGIAIVMAFFAPLAVLISVKTDVGRLFSESNEQVVALFGGGILVAALGIWDDLKGASARLKLAVQVACGSLVWAAGVKIAVIANPFGAAIPLGVAGYFVTVLWVVGVINAVNLIDGLDGLASGVALAGLGINFILALSAGHQLNLLFTSCLAGAILGFLIYNFHPASIFMGDTGSMFLGFALATTSIISNTKSSTAVSLVVPVIALGLPIVDTFLVFFRRAISGRPVFAADKEHVHHRLMSVGFSHGQAVVFLYGVCVFLGAAGLLLTSTQGLHAVLVLAGVSLATAVFYNRLGYGLRLIEGIKSRPRNRMLRSLSAAMVRTLAAAESREAIKLHLQYFLEVVGAEYFEIRSGPELLIEWNPRNLERSPAISVMQLSSKTHARLVVGWQDFDRDVEIALEAITPALATSLERVERRHDHSEKRVA